ncbi:hypothetical protein EC973_001659 [Apophysomyces ossiformis]|uniref:HECT-type E3 ubiquitin transferase n=1 Tax=Apophysomyces ossiformis TaxID=679940 RepID=A0A8H7BY45_9FUNG|nr:hypothetical protein EC973_001659 [Apophysomyces ossiformis]
MPTLLDSRTTQVEQQSFLYQQQPPPSPIATSSSTAQQNPSSNLEEEQHKQTTSVENHSVNNKYDESLEYIVSPKPSCSRINQDVNNDATNMPGAESPHSTSSTTTKRRSSTLALKPNANGSVVKLKKADTLRGPNLKESCTVTHVVHNNMLCQHFPCQVKQPQSKYTTSNANSSPVLPAPASVLPIPANSAVSHMPILSLSPRSSSDKSKRSLKKKKLKDAKSTYEANIELYFRQLTVGCGKSDCMNRFCATGRGGILNLHPQAALVMAIQLAAKPERRFCSENKPDITINNTCTTESAESSTSMAHVLTEENQNSVFKPFLHTVFSSSPFLSLFTLKDERTRIKRRPPTKRKSSLKGSSRRNQSITLSEQSTAPESNPHWMSGFWCMLGAMNRRLASIQSEPGSAHCEEQHSERLENSREIDDSYYQLDSESSSSCSIYSSSASSYESDASDDDMLLAIKPITIDLAAASKQMKTLKNVEDSRKMNRWCRAVFQNWEGIGHSFLSAEHFIPSLRRSVAFVNLSDVSIFFDKVINSDQLQMVEEMSQSFETLLDRMNMNVDAVIDADRIEETEPCCIDTMIEWCRALLCVSQWISLWPDSLVTKHNSEEYSSITHWSWSSTWPGILNQKFIQVVSKIALRKRCLVRAILRQMMASMTEKQMSRLVKLLQRYLLAHFHSGPYKQGEHDTMIMTAKCLELLYEANLWKPSSPVIPASEFYNEGICKKINIKDEYRIWRRVLLHGEGRHSAAAIASAASPSYDPGSHRYCGLNEQQRRTRLFLTTTSSSILLPYPFANEYQFSWFSYSFLLPPAVKGKILHIDAMAQMSLEYEDACVNHTLVVHAQRLLSDAPRMVRNIEANLKSATCPYLLLEIRREHFIEDAWHQVSCKWADLKKPLKVKFIEGGEEGMDQGGVQKEFFSVLFDKLASDEMGIFTIDPETRLCWIRPVVEPDVRIYEMVGIMMGLAIYNGVIMNLQFPKVLWKAVVIPNEALVEAMVERRQLFVLSDLEDGWPALANGLHQLLQWEDEVRDVFCRNYEISLDIFGQGVVTVPLKENGDKIPVTNENREAYVSDYCKYFLYEAQRDQILALRRGVWSVVGNKALGLCTADELEMVACGLLQGPESIPLDMKELEEVTAYDDGYGPNHTTIRQFWSVVHRDLSVDQQRKLLLFVTASDRIPVGGLKELTFVIQRNGPDSDRLPTSLTCFSRLLLPEYKSREKLRDRLVTAIENAKGFGLV